MSKHNVPYLAMRSGRPRWIPGPALRARGFRGQDLKDAAGAWLKEGPAIEAAKALNAAAASSPAPAIAATRSSDDRTVDALIARFERCSLFTSTARNTQRSYRLHMRLIGEWSGDLPVVTLTRAAMRDFYDALREERGHATANAVMRTLKRVMNYATKELEWTAVNKAAGFEMSDPDGRRVLWSFEEILTVVAAAEWMDLASQGDGVLLGAMTGQRQEDIITLLESAYDGSRIVLKQKKTGAIVRILLTAQARARIAAMRERKKKRWPKIAHATMLVNEKIDRAYHPDASYFRTLFRQVRDFAGGLTDAKGKPLDLDAPMPNLPFTPLFSILTLRWSDLRDTAVTWLARAGCSVPEIATITGHSLATVSEILDKHYLVREDPLGDAASAKLETFLTKSGM